MLNDTEVATASLKDTTTVKFEQDRFNIDLGGQTVDTVTMTFVLENYVPVTMVVNVKSDGTVTVINENELSTDVKNLSIVDNTISFNQLRQGPITEKPDGSGVVAFGNLKEYFGSTGSVIPGQVNSHQFRITNPSNNRYRIIGAELFANNDAEFANGMYRTESKIIKSYYEHFNPTYEIKEGSAVASGMASSLQFNEYLEGTPENREMTQAIFKNIGVIESGSYVDFDNFGYVLDGNMVPNAYKPTFNSFEFGFNLQLGIVGIDGYAFYDSDRDGYQDENETVMAGVELELLSNGVVVASSQTLDSGYYAFPNVDPGSYQIRVKIPENLNITSKVNALLGNRFNPSGLSDTVTVVDNENYHYRVGFVSPLPVLNGTVEAKHVLVDETGTIVEILDVETITGKLRSAYLLSPKTYDAYEFVGHEGAPANGSFTVDSQSMTFIYRKKVATLIVTYVDVNGRTIAPTTLVHKIKDTYTVSIFDINGYTFNSIQEGSAPLSGKLGAGNTVVTLVYAQNIDPVIPDAVVLEVNYRDEKGHVIAPQVQTTHDLNRPYAVTPIAIKGYTFKGIDVTSEPLEGTLIKPKTVVTLIYEKNESDKELPNTGVSQSHLGFILRIF
ncbi:MucBP domain-containing protein [Erysipelothrix aquatica]|uniref:MucBP domain-containing protein n=1 Tax=Erysipelothrix aquatica TaxID=2683714 RepID=UPI001357E962|nr:MucBP domain-containing protein [Erysipelothrix aquatica]